MMKFSDDEAIKYGSDITVEELKKIQGVFGFSKKHTRTNDGFPGNINSTNRGSISGLCVNNETAGSIFLNWGSTLYVKTFNHNLGEESAWVKLADKNSLEVLDTPYYTLKMQQQGIYDDYVEYRDELHEYEKAQNQEEDTMLLPVIQEPVVPESVKQFAEKYKLI
ncbi:MAG: hypothetical protein ACRC7S_12475 [Cetobacterium sp.]